MTELLNLVFQNNNLFANKTLLWTVCLRLWITGTVKMLLILLNFLQRPIISLYNASIYHQEPLNSGGIHFVLPIYVIFFDSQVLVTADLHFIHQGSQFQLKIFFTVSTACRHTAPLRYGHSKFESRLEDLS